MSKPEAIIWDLDNTLIDVTSILKYADVRHPESLGAPNYDLYHKFSVDCPPRADVLAQYRMKLSEGFIPLVVTARQAQYLRPTSKWLLKHGVYPREIHFRENGDTRPDMEIKAEILDRLLDHYDIVGAWDDNPHVIKYWESRGIPVTVVPSWPEWAK